jgi:hypothetical protein
MNIKFEDYCISSIKQNRVWMFDFILKGNKFGTYLAKDPNNNWAIFSISQYDSSSTDGYVVFNQRLLQEKVIQLFRLRLLAKGEHFTNSFLFITSSTTKTVFDWADGKYIEVVN